MSVQWRTLASALVFFAAHGCSEEATEANPGSELSTAPTDDDRCETGEIRDGNGECTRTCTTDSECLNGTACETSVGFCVPQLTDTTPPTTSDDRKPPGGRGAPDDESPDGENPDDRVPDDENDDTECAELLDCQEGQLCIDGSCKGLDDIGNNGEGEEAPDLGFLDGVVSTCADSSDCGLLMQCVGGVCVGCLDDIQCNPGFSCSQGVCVETGLANIAECLQASCGQDETCLWTRGECAVSCSGNAECGEAESCMPGINACVPEFGCDSTADCSDGLFCVEGICVGCADNSQCGANEYCVALACLPNLDGEPNGAACDAASCASDESCDPADGSCYPTNGTCSADEQCPDALNCGPVSLCEGCSDNGDCREGQSCLFGTCIPTGDAGGGSLPF